VGGSRATPFILVVEDDQDSREALCHFLRTCGYPVETASNGADALDLLGRSEPALVLTDIYMPIVDGRELITRIRQIPRYRRLPIGIITGEEGPLEGFETLETFLKPVDPSQLLAFVKRSVGAPVTAATGKRS
jgi:CheY-like chemotaxis protein